MYKLGDIVQLIKSIGPGKVNVGCKGTIIDIHDGEYTIEFYYGNNYSNRISYTLPKTYFKKIENHIIKYKELKTKYEENKNKIKLLEGEYLSNINSLSEENKNIQSKMNFMDKYELKEMNVKTFDAKTILDYLSECSDEKEKIKLLSELLQMKDDD